MNATVRQKQFLRALGHKQCDVLSKEDASRLIDRLLDEEKSSGRAFPCPYCKARFGPRPKRTKTCPSCKKTIVHISGRFYTQDKVEELNQKEWLNDSRQDNRTNVRDDWKDERAIRKEFGGPHFVGYLLRVGQHCTASAHLNGVLVLVEDAAKAPELLPPFDECRYDTCECEYEAVSAHEVPKGTRIAEFTDPKRQDMLKKSRVAKSGGCAGMILVVVIGVLIALSQMVTL